MVDNSLANFGAAHQIKSFYYGNSERILSSLPSEISYPTLWLEYADFKMVEQGDHITQETIGAFFILKNVVVDDYEAQDQVLEDMFLLFQKILKYLRETYTIIWAGDTFSSETVSSQLADNCYGYRITFTVKYQEVTFLA